MLLLERCHDRHHGFDKPGPVGTLGPKAAFAPQDTRRIARSAALFVGSTPSTRTNVHKASYSLSTSRQTPSVLAHATRLAGLEQARDVAPNRAHRDRGTAHG